MIGRLLGRRGILSDREQELRARERELLDRLESALRRFGPDTAGEDLRRLAEAREQLEGLFLLVVAGEFNSGKSSFINALLGERVLPEGVTPTTDRINLLHYGPEVAESTRGSGILERTHPTELLREITIVDTPGTNAVLRRHEELTRDFVPRADLVLFITSADRPFTESEREFLALIREWGKKILFVVNKIDLLSDPLEREEVLVYVRDNAAALLGEAPELFGVSARQGLAARLRDDEARWEASGFRDVEEYLRLTLDQEERIRLKLLNPLNVGLRLANRYQEAAFLRLKLLAQDIEAIRNVDRQLAAFHQEMLREVEPRLARLDLLCSDMERRGDRFFEETVRIGRIRTLLDSESVRRAFEREVVGETPRLVEDEVNRIIDWLMERNLRVWRDVADYVETRRAARQGEGIIGEVGKGFDYNRQALLDSVGRVAREQLGRYDRETEARAIANEVQGTFAATALAEAGALGLGTLVATVITGAAADVSGILLAASLAVGGLYIIPRKRRQAQRDFRRRVAELRTGLREGLARQVHLEIGQATERINQAVAPYRRFVESQQRELEEARAELVTAEESLARLRGEIEQGRRR
ncbi:MAG TPA: dynamin family protein [Gemmatimonadales bacterium]|nr:dynamin family protein [Gemmatimonadales bacterium]